MKNTEVFQFTVPADLKDWLREYAGAMGLSMASVIVLALRKMEREETQNKVNT